MFVLTTSIQQPAGGYHQWNKREKRLSHPYWKGKNKTEFADDMILYIGNPKNSIF